MKELTEAIISLFQEERLYAELMLQMDRIVTTSKSVPTAGVCIKDRIQLYVNEDFFKSITPEERVAILKHECEHILRAHIARAKELAPEIYNKSDDFADDIINQAKHKLVNVAADCSINVGIKNIMKDACTPSQFGLADGETMEWYAGHLKDNEKLKQLTEYDGHSLWDESEGNQEILKEKIRKAVNDAASKTRAAGKLSADQELIIDRLNYRPKDWRADLRRFAARALEVKLFQSKKKRNRRYGIMYPGIVKEETLHIGVAIDTSGSMSDEAINQAMAEIANIAKNAKVTVVEADAEVKDSYVFDPKKTYTVKGRGGTEYQPALDYFTKETDVDGVIYIGDMDVFDEVITKPKYPVLWAIIGDQEPPVKWGFVTKIVVTK